MQGRPAERERQGKAAACVEEKRKCGHGPTRDPAHECEDGSFEETFWLGHCLLKLGDWQRRRANPFDLTPPAHPEFLRPSRALPWVWSAPIGSPAIVVRRSLPGKEPPIDSVVRRSVETQQVPSKSPGSFGSIDLLPGLAFLPVWPK